MIDTNRLRDHLSQLATATQTGVPRSIQGQTGDDLKVGILREIDKIILPRCLSFQNELGDCLHFEVSARRIFRFKFSNSLQQFDEKPDFDGPVLESPTDGLFEELNDRLMKFLAGSSLLNVDASKVDVRSDLSKVGCAATSVADAWSLNLYPTKDTQQGSFLAQVVGLCQSEILALSIFESGKLTVQSGAKSHLARMNEIDPNQLKALRAKIVHDPDGKQDIGCLVFNVQADHTTALVLLQEAQTLALICIASSDIPKTLANVQTALR